MKYFTVLLLVSFSFASAQSQTTWHDPLRAGYPVVQNQGWTSETGGSYTRLPARAKGVVRNVVWELSQNSAGLAVHFFTNAKKITVRYQVSGSFAMNHMPATGKSGMDLYAIDADGKWMLHTDKFSFGDTIIYTFNKIDYEVKNKSGYEFRLFLPLYNDVKWMQIGVPDSTAFRFMPASKEKPVVVYGTSIAQGGCASRPGMGWTNILSRRLNRPVTNLAFSGNGPLEKELVDYISELDAAVYVYDCLPNMGGLDSAEIYKRVLYGVTALRKKHATTPILLADHIGYMNDQLDSGIRSVWQKTNKAQMAAFRHLQKQGVKHLYYLTKEEINFPRDGCVDLIHPNDWGMQVYAEAYTKKIKAIVK